MGRGDAVPGRIGALGGGADFSQQFAARRAVHDSLDHIHQALRVGFGVDGFYQTIRSGRTEPRRCLAAQHLAFMLDARSRPRLMPSLCTSSWPYVRLRPFSHAIFQAHCPCPLQAQVVRRLPRPFSSVQLPLQHTQPVRERPPQLALANIGRPLRQPLPHALNPPPHDSTPATLPPASARAALNLPLAPAARQGCGAATSGAAPAQMAARQKTARVAQRFASYYRFNEAPARMQGNTYG